MSWLRFIRCASRARDELTRKVIQTALRRYQRLRIPLFTGHPLSPPMHTLSCAALQMHPPSLFLTWDATASPSTRSQCRLATPSGELLLPNPLESRPPFAFIRSPFPRYGYGPLCNTTEAACPVPIPLIQDVFVHLAILLGIDQSSPLPFHYSDSGIKSSCPGGGMYSRVPVWYLPLITLWFPFPPP
ncbi:hypothetical protein K438DRAFT_2027697 [Mycena galopus ATCC 62051]|nr:hypothetical protein K438DRAFT_2027697 [Mycena galopus ATCC 62051]